MISVAPDTQFEATLDSAPTGLEGTIGVRIIDPPTGTVVLARTTVGIEENPAGSGIYTVALTSPDVKGAYLVVWDTGGVEPRYAPEELRVGWSVTSEVDPLDIDWRPAVIDVAAFLLARTVDTSGERQGTFNNSTVPTGDQVEVLITKSTATVASLVGRTEIANAALKGRARDLSAIYTAMLVELSYYPEQTSDDNSTFEQLRSLYDSGVRSLVDGLADTSATAKGFYSIPLRSEMYVPTDA